MPTPPLDIGICSWTLELHREPNLRPEVMRFDLRTVQLAMGPFVDMDERQARRDLDLFRDSPLRVASTMISFPGEDYSSLATIHGTGGFDPDAQCEERIARTLAAGQLTRHMGVSLLTTHAGFIPEAGTTRFPIMIARLRRIIDALSSLGVTLCFETGQETAQTLATFLGALDRKYVGVNFDPANMLLYGKGDPVAAARLLVPWIRQIHAKDAKLNPQAAGDQWRGDECPVGMGDARVADTLRELISAGYRGDVIIETERGSNRGKAIALAISHLKTVLKSK